jgi:phosphate transport system substrate-binding protein
MRKSAGILATVAILSSALMGAPAANALGAADITAGGSSFAGGIITACATAYAGANPTAGAINYNSAAGSTTGKGFFASGAYDFGASDFVYTGAAGDTLPSGAKYVAVTSGPVAIAYNLKVDGVKVAGLRLTPQLVAKIYKGTITSWTHSEILAVQTTAVKAKLKQLSSTTINPVYRTTGSGTSYNFSGYLAATTGNFTQSSNWVTATGDAVPAGSSASSSSTLKSAVDSNANTIGYLDLKDASGMTSGEIAFLRNEANQYYQPTVIRTSAFLKAHSNSAINDDGSFNLDFTKVVSGGYNASLITYAIIKTGGTASAKTANLKKFLQYMLYTCGPSISAAKGYTFIADPLRAKGYSFVKLIK